MAYTIDGFVPWPLLPDWKQGVRETLEWRTRVLGPTLTGMRQKRNMRLSPRRSFEFSVTPHKHGKRLLDNIRFGQGKKEFMLPIWHDRQSLKLPLAVGSTEIPCSTVGFDFDKYALLRSGDLNTFDFEVVEIDSIASDHLELVNNTGRTWAAASRLYPLRRAMLSDFTRSQVLTPDVSTLQVSFEVIEPCDWPVFEFPDQYLSRPVWEFKHDWREARNLGFNRIISAVDNDTSIPVYFDLPDQVFGSLDTRWVVRGRVDNAEMRSVLYALAGRYKSVWVPTRMDDLKLAATIASGSTQLTVDYCGYTVFIAQKNGRRDLRIELRDGSVFYRRVTNSVESSSGGVLREILTINSALGVEVPKEQIRSLSFLMLMQQSSDSVTLSHETDASGVTTAPIVFEGVVEPPAD